MGNMKIINFLIAVILMFSDVINYFFKLICNNINYRLFKIGLIIPAVLGASFASLFNLEIGIPLCVFLCFILLGVYSFIFNTVKVLLSRIITVNLRHTVRLTWSTSTKRNRLQFVTASVFVLILYCLLYVLGISNLTVSFLLAGLGIVGFYLWFIVNINGGLTNE